MKHFKHHFYAPGYSWTRVIVVLIALFCLCVALGVAQAQVPTTLTINWSNPTSGINAKGDTVPLAGASALTSVRVFVSTTTIPTTVDLSSAKLISRPADSGGLLTRFVYSASLAPETKLFIRVAACNAPRGTGSVQCTFSPEITYTTAADTVVTPGPPENVSVTFTATISGPP